MFSITLFRHGQSGYTQGSHPVPLEAAADLCARPLFEAESVESRRARAVDEVRRGAIEVSRKLSPAQLVSIISSPAGRTLHTAKVIRDTLVERGFSVAPIQPDLEIGEVGNFEFTLMEPLVCGGQLTYQAGAETYDFVVRKAETNPRDLTFAEYFMSDAVHDLSASVMQAWPESYVKRLKAIERFASVKRRALARIRKVATEPEGHFIFVSHEAAALYFADRYTGGRQKGLTPGTFISIDRTPDGRLVITRVGEIADGDSNTDFITQPS